MSGPFKMGGTALYGKPTKKGVEQADPSQELKPPTPAFSRQADPLAEDGEPTTRTSRNLVKNDGSVNTVAKYTDSPAKKTTDDGVKKKKETNEDRAVKDMQYEKDSSNETFDADAYRAKLREKKLKPKS